MQIGHVRWREQRPVTAFHHPLHEQVGNPIGCVHVVSATAIVAGVLAQLEEFLDVEMPGLEIRADRTLTFASVVRESGRRHVRLVGIDLEIDHDRAHHHRFDGAHAGEYRAAVSDPVAFADGLATHQRGDLWHRGDAQIVGVGRAAECRLGAIPAARPMPISAHAALTASRHAQPQELVAQSFGQRVRRRREIDLLAAGHSAVRFQQAADHRQRERLRKMRKSRCDALAVPVVVQIVVDEGQGRRARAGDAAGCRIADHAPTRGPVHLPVGGTASRLPEVDAAR